MIYSASGLGITDEELFAQLYAIARQNFPNETAKAEAWVQQQAINYGLIKARTVGQEIFANPLTWLAGGALLGWLLKR